MRSPPHSAQWPRNPPACSHQGLRHDVSSTGPLRHRAANAPTRDRGPRSAARESACGAGSLGCGIAGWKIRRDRGLRQHHQDLGPRAGWHTQRKEGANRPHRSSLCGGLSPTQPILISASQDKTGRVWTLADGKTKFELKGHTDIVDTIAISPDGKSIATGSADKSVRLWNPADGKEMKSLGSHGASVYSVAFSPDSKALASASADNP